MGNQKEAGQEGRKNIYLLTYDHGGYILWGDQFEEKIDSAVDWLEKYPKFKIGLDNETFAYDEYARTNPAIIAKINSVLTRFKGRFGIGSCTYGQPLSVFISEESNARQIVYAVRANRKHFGQTPNIYAISEHALHNQIPQLARQAGYQGAIMRTHFMMYGYNPTYDAPYGTWIGEDGSRIPTVPTYENEGASFGVTTLDNWVLTRWPDRTTHSLEEFGEKFRHLTPLLASRYDDIVHRHEGMLIYVEDFDEYQWVILEDLPALYGEPTAEFRPSSNDFRVRMPWGYCGNEIFNGCSAAESAVTLAERAAAAAFLLGAGDTGGAGGADGTICAQGVPLVQRQLEDAWKNLMVAQHHDVQICGLLNDSRKYLPASRALSERVVSESMRSIAAQFATEGAFNLVVYNTHSFDISERVEIEVRQRGAAGYNVRLGDEEIPSAPIVLDSNRGGPTRAVVVFEANVPANTIRVYHIDTAKPTEKQTAASAALPTEDPAPAAAIALAIAKAQAAVTTAQASAQTSEQALAQAQASAADRFWYDKSAGKLVTPLYELELDEYGIRRLFDRELGLLLVDSAKGRLFSGVIDGAEEASQGKWAVTIGGGGAKAAYVGLIGGIPLIFEMNFFGTRRRIDCTARFIHNGEKIGGVDIPGKVNGFAHENKLRFALETRLGGDSVGIRDLPYVISETDDPLYIQGNYWAARKGADFGVALFNRGCRGAVSNGAEFSLPLVYANTYIWGTRMLHGESSHEFAIYPFSARIASYADLHKAALSYHYPPLTLATGAHEGPLKTSHTLLNLRAGEGVIMTALYPEGDAVILRSCEYRGIREDYRPECLSGALGEQVTIMNEPVTADREGAAVSGESSIGPWEIKSYRIYRGA
ncbi:MAG: hypothetical protein LBU58_06515 [Clostridiales bacterium]|jgi:alpha-mannosidase|nr:hypothetical protein [Clostridiales bacterium]